MQRICFARIICAIVIFTGTWCAADVEQVLCKVGDGVTMECPELLPGETYGGMVWRHNTKLLASMTISQRIDIADNILKDKLSILSDMMINISSVSQDVIGTFECTLEFTTNSVNDSVSSKSNVYNLIVQAAPDMPKQPKIQNVTSSQVTLLWEASNSNNSPIKSYILNVYKCNEGTPEKTVTTSSDLRESTIDQLEPYTCYKVSVSALNDIGTSFPSRNGEFYTEKDVNSTEPTFPRAVPDNFRAIPSTYEIQLKWDKPSSHWNGENLGYEIRYGMSTDTMKKFRIEDPDSTETTLESMKPYTLYTVAIKVYNSVGLGPETAMEVQTLEGVPSKPRIIHINNRQAKSFYVHWEPPLVTNGKLIHYKVMWSHRGVSKSRVIAGHLTNPMTAFITDLEPYTGYEVQVAAGTKGGYGEFTKKFPALTDVTAPSAPRNINLTKLSKTSIHLKWDRPEIVYRKVDYYLIKLWDHKGDDLQDYIKGDLTQHTMNQLGTDSRYHLKVAGITKTLFRNLSLIGDYSEPIIFELGAGNSHTTPKRLETILGSGE